MFSLFEYRKGREGPGKPYTFLLSSFSFIFLHCYLTRLRHQEGERELVHFSFVGCFPMMMSTTNPPLSFHFHPFVFHFFFKFQFSSLFPLFFVHCLQEGGIWTIPGMILLPSFHFPFIFLRCSSSFHCSSLLFSFSHFPSRGSIGSLEGAHANRILRISSTRREDRCLSKKISKTRNEKLGHCLF